MIPLKKYEKMNWGDLNFHMTKALRIWTVMDMKLMLIAMTMTLALDIDGNGVCDGLCVGDGNYQ